MLKDATAMMTMRRLLGRGRSHRARNASFILAIALLFSYAGYQYSHSKEPEFLTQFHARDVTDPFVHLPDTKRLALDGDFETVRKAMRDELPGSGWRVWEKGAEPKSIDMGIYAERGGETLTLLLQCSQVLVRRAEDQKLVPGQVDEHAQPVIVHRTRSPNWFRTKLEAISRWFGNHRQ